MKRLTQFFLVALLLLAAGLGTGDADAQGTIRYTSLTGKSTTNGTCTNPADPCSLAAVLGVEGLTNDTLAILVAAAGATVEVSSDLEIEGVRNFQFYTNDGNPTSWVAGTLKFKGNLTFPQGGVLYSKGDKLTRIIASPTVTITANQLGNDQAGPNLPGKVTISDGRRVLINQNATQTDLCIAFDDLTIAGRVQITANDCLNQEAVIHIRSSLTVNAQLQLAGDVVLNVTADAGTKDHDKRFIAVNHADGIESFGGTLRLAVIGYTEPDFEAAKAADIYKDKKCFQVRGSGPIELDLEVRTAQYICVSVPRLGAGGTSTIYGGTVRLSSTSLDGNWLNRGAARTEVLSGLSLEDLTVDGRWVSSEASLAPAANPVILPDDQGAMTKEEYDTWIDGTGGNGVSAFLEAPVIDVDNTTLDTDGLWECDEARRPGVHLAKGATIMGDLTFYNIAKQDMAGYTPAVTADPNADPPIQASPASGRYAAACQSGLFLTGSGMTTVEGTFKAMEVGATAADNAPSADADTLGAYAYLGGNSHNLTLLGDVDIAGTMSIVDMAKPAGGSDSINGCTASLPSSGAAGNKVIFGGSAYQAVTFSSGYDDDANAATPVVQRTLVLDAVTIDKSGGDVEFSGGASGMQAKYLEPLNGTLYTGTALSDGSLLDAGSVTFTAGSGTVENQGGSKVYRTSPASIVYTGGDHVIGAERGTAGTVTILSSGVVSMGKGSITNLNLYAGTLKATGAVTVSGTIDIGNTGMLDLSGGSLNHSGPELKYTGDMARSAGMAWAADTMMAAKVTDVRTITIDECAKDKGGPTVTLNAGYTSLGGHLNVTNGALDLNGGGLVVQDRVGGNTGAQEIVVGKNGFICDSKGGVACSGSAALKEDLEQGDELLAALVGIREDNSKENQAALDAAVDAFASADYAKTGDQDMGIIIGYVEKDQLPLTSIIVNEAKMLPMVQAVGGQVNLSGRPTGKQISLAGLSVSDKAATVTVDNSVGRVQLTGDLTVSLGNLVLEAAEAVLSSSHMQTGGTVNSSAKHNVMGDFSVTGGAFKQAAGQSLSLGGNVALDSSQSEFKGSTILIGTKAQTVSSMIKLGDVTVNSGGGVMLGSDVTQGASADLTLQRGHIATGDHGWSLENMGIERDLAIRSAVPTSAANATTDEATVWQGNRASFVAGEVSRKVAYGVSGGGTEKGGYLFPLGMLSDTRNRYRPAILSFATDVSPEAVTVTVSTHSSEVTWPAEGITTVAVGGNITLDTYAPMMWKVEYSAIPALGATLRVAADGLAGVNDAHGLRLVQWDCDGTNARLAGEFDLSESGTDPNSVSANGRINGVPNTTMDGIDVEECSIVGIAANYAENPIGEAPPAATPMANVQLIHNIVGATVDVYVDDVLVADNFAFQTATSLATQIAAGPHMVHVVPATAPDNSTPLATIPVELAANGMYTVVANGDLTNFNFAMLANTRSESVADDKVEFRVVHGAAGLGEVDLRSLTETGRWANNLEFNEATGYRTAEATVHNVELLDGHTQIDVFEVDLGDYINGTLVFALSGTGSSSAMGLTLMGVATDGSVFFPQVVTSAATEELPTEFALQGNYPNPFNPSTQIQFDLPSTADVTVQVIDLLGRMVLTLPTQSVEAGARRTVELDGSSLASGHYMYRLIAKMESGVQVETGRMVLIK